MMVTGHGNIMSCLYKYKIIDSPMCPCKIGEQILTYLLTYLLTAWCRVLLEKLTGLQLFRKFPAFHGTRSFITALTSVRQLSLSWEGEQTTGRILSECDLAKQERDKLKAEILRTENWPVNKDTLINKYTKIFKKFVDSIQLENL